MTTQTDEIECTDCDGHGWIAKRLPKVGGGLHEVNCEFCNGTGWRAPTPDELDNMAEDAYTSQFEGEPPLSQRERDEMQAKRDAQWGVK
jgi:DnaJ-class molecular chaperone